MPLTHSTEIINGEEITILIETSNSLESNAQTSERTRATTQGVAEDVLRHAQNVFSNGVDLVRHCATQVVTGIQSLDDSLKPEEMEVQLAIKLRFSGGCAMLVNVSGEAQMQVNLKWKLKNTLNPS